MLFVVSPGAFMAQSCKLFVYSCNLVCRNRKSADLSSIYVHIREINIDACEEKFRLMKVLFFFSKEFISSIGTPNVTW